MVGSSPAPTTTTKTVSSIISRGTVSCKICAADGFVSLTVVAPKGVQTLSLQGSHTEGVQIALCLVTDAKLSELF